MTDTPETNTAPIDAGFQIVIGDETTTAPATIGETAPAVTQTATGGLTYQNATVEERTQMDAIMAKIDLLDPETIVALGKAPREELADLADKILNSIDPGVKLAFAEALKAVIDAIKSNSLDAIKARIKDGSVAVVGRKIWGTLTGKDTDYEMSKEKIGRFMTDVSETRKTIAEVVDRLQEQVVTLNGNYNNINALGKAVTIAAQKMRVERAATAEFIRRVETGEITTLTDLEATMRASGRADDQERLQVAQANWNLVRTVDGDELASIAVYDMNVAQLAFVRQANHQNRIQTNQTLTTTIAEWKTQLAVFALITTEAAAANFLKATKQLTEQAVKTNVDVFDALVDSTIKLSAQGTYSLRQIIDAQGKMAAKLEGVGGQVEAEFVQLAKDKEALVKSSASFRESAVKVYAKGHLGATPTRGDALPGATPSLPNATP